MDLSALILLLIRRWFVTLPMIVLSVALMIGGMSQVDPTYEADGSLLLLSPALEPDQLNPRARNPLLEFTKALDTTAAVIEGVLETPERQQDLAGRSLSSDYSVEVDTDAPILNITARSSRPDVAVDTVTALFAAVDVELATRQAAVDAPTNLFIHTQVLVSPDGADELTIDRLRAALALTALGIVLTVLAVLAADRLILRLADRSVGEPVARPDLDVILAPITTPHAAEESPPQRAPQVTTRPPVNDAAAAAAASLREPEQGRSGPPTSGPRPGPLTGGRPESKPPADRSAFHSPDGAPQRAQQPPPPTEPDPRPTTGPTPGERTTAPAPTPTGAPERSREPTPTRRGSVGLPALPPDDHLKQRASNRGSEPRQGDGPPQR